MAICSKDVYQYQGFSLQKEKTPISNTHCFFTEKKLEFCYY